MKKLKVEKGVFSHALWATYKGEDVYMNGRLENF